MDCIRLSLTISKYDKPGFCLKSQPLPFTLVFLLQATVCLCDRDTCNGPSLPPREMIEEDHGVIDIEEVVRELNEEPEEVLPEPVSSLASTRDFVTSSLAVIIFVINLYVIDNDSRI